VEQKDRGWGGKTDLNVQEDVVWMDVLLVLVILFPLLAWSGVCSRRSRAPLPQIREQLPSIKLLEFPAAPADRPHQSPAA